MDFRSSRSILQSKAQLISDSLFSFQLSKKTTIHMAAGYTIAHEHLGTLLTVDDTQTHICVFGKMVFPVRQC